MNGAKPDSLEMKAARQSAERSDKVGSMLDAANLQKLREHLWTTLQKNPDLKEVRTTVSCLLDTRRMIAMDEKSRAQLDEYGPGEQEEAMFRIFGELPEPDCSAVALLEHDITAASAAPQE